MGGTKVVSAVRIEGRNYWLVVGSDVERDGVFLECTPESDGTQVLVEVFFSDKDQSFTVQTSGGRLPVALLKLVIAEAERRLPPGSLDESRWT